MIWRTTHTACFIAILTTSLTVTTGCGGGSDEESAAVPASAVATTTGTTDAAPRVTPTSDNGEASPFRNAPKPTPVVNPVVLFRTSQGDITVELDAKNAPRTVENFLQNYVHRGAYNDTVFHYVDPASMIVGGGYDSQHEMKETRAEIRSEADNGLSNKKGTLAMARAPDFAHSATSQFFFNLVDNAQFDHQSVESAQTYGYCVFGKVTGGMAVLDKIAAVPTKESEISPSLPVEPVVILSVEITK
jgi:cyclophilin family peptidyl-prolyl cis-trans isomerase